MITTASVHRDTEQRPPLRLVVGGAPKASDNACYQQNATFAAEARPSWRTVADAFLAAGVDSPATRRAYRRHLEEAFAVLAVATLADLTAPALARYRAALVADGRGPASHAQALAALRAFLRWAGTFGAHTLGADVLGAALRIPRAKVQKPYQVATEPEIAALFAAAPPVRDRAVLAVLLGAGLRAAELVALDVADVHEGQEGGAVIHVRQGKGRKDRQVPIRGEVLAAVVAYLADTERTLATEGPLFRAHDRGAARRSRRRITTRTVGAIVHAAVQRTTVAGKALSPHSLRHTFAIRTLRNSGNVVALAKLLGHASVATTQTYVDHLAVAELRNGIPALPC